MLMLLIKDARTLRKSRGGGKKHAEKKNDKKKQKEKKFRGVGKIQKKNPRWDRGVSREKDIR